MEIKRILLEESRAHISMTGSKPDKKDLAQAAAATLMMMSKMFNYPNLLKPKLILLDSLRNYRDLPETVNTKILMNVSFQLNLPKRKTPQ